MYYTMENFINYCDDYQIAQEGIGSTIVNALKKLWIKLKHLVTRLIYSAHKLKSWYIPQPVKKAIETLENDSASFTRSNQMSVEGGAEKIIEEIKAKSRPYKYVFTNSRIGSFDDSEYVQVETSKVIASLKNLDKELEKLEIDSLSRNPDVNQSNIYYTQNMIKIIQFKMSIVKQYFNWGKQKNKKGDVIDLGENFTVTIDEDSLY